VLWETQKERSGSLVPIQLTGTLGLSGSMHQLLDVVLLTVSFGRSFVSLVSTTTRKKNKKRRGSQKEATGAAVRLKTRKKELVAE
jgi:hypothetical protein